MRFYIILFSFFFSYTFAQNNKQTAFSFDYNHQFPIGSLANVFGDNSSVGVSFIQQKENNFFLGVQANYLFGDDVKDSTIFKNIQTSNGGILAAEGTYANINLFQRGFDGYILGGYAYHPDEKSLSGIYFSAGIGFLQYKIFIDTENQNIPQLNEEMKKGYDQLHNGISTKWDISYRYYGARNNFQFYIGTNLTAAYTQNKRPYSFSSNQYNDDLYQWDRLLGINVGIIIPVQRKNDEKFHYY